ncbi:hypothetical protein Ato02nite_018580 [Paractinoplanes toevensis]|uniref:Uncharacterized protein n=1 Tax=Paractinoplanes toevensis TaxID=571911 RepID=A0A919W312_9ACTN|nr:hypothetical protein Ato02nite_018580 [Actinoplanes toevensis]
MFAVSASVLLSGAVGVTGQASQATGGAKRAVDPVRAAVAEAGVRSADLLWNDPVITRLPRTAEGINALGILVRELPKVQQLPRRLDRLRADLTELQKRARLAQKAASIRACDKLIEESSRPLARRRTGPVGLPVSAAVLALYWTPPLPLTSTPRMVVRTAGLRMGLPGTGGPLRHRP